MSVIPLSTESKQDWRTPKWFFMDVQNYLGVRFELDVAASADNALCPRFFDGTLPERDGLVAHWDAREVWCNPPYKDITPWVEKAVYESLQRRTSSVLLLPARLETNWYRSIAPLAWTKIITPRLPFEGGSGNSPPHGSMLLIITPESVAYPTGLHNLRVEIQRYVKPALK